MATDKPRFTITISEDLYEKVNEYQHNMKFSTQTKAIVDLIERGARSLGLVVDHIEPPLDLNEKAPSSLKDEALQIAERYANLDVVGKGAVKAILDYEESRMNLPLAFAARKSDEPHTTTEPDQPVEI